MRPPTSRVPDHHRPSRPAKPSPEMLLRRARSGIHGSGVYSRAAISAGQAIIEYTGERITKAEGERREAERLERLRRGLPASTFVFELNKRYDLDARRGGNVSRFINHSCEPNCRAEQDRGRIWIVALRDITAGEEITIDYGFPLANWTDNPCRCGKSACVGFIVAKGQRWRLRRALRSAALPSPLSTVNARSSARSVSPAA